MTLITATLFLKTSAKRLFVSSRRLLMLVTKDNGKLRSYLEELMKDLDADGDGDITLEEWQRKWHNHPFCMELLMNES
eukprot:GABW01000182.1.p1 GENE.GABW01000182.1~~GABW01000182.1.p1  ORF type:complete len:78 (-),score=1.35 GABW01000182.1:128-361(-)